MFVSNIIQHMEKSHGQGYDYYNIVLEYEYSEGGYRIFEIKAKKDGPKCETKIEIVDEQ